MLAGQEGRRQSQLQLSAISSQPLVWTVGKLQDVFENRLSKNSLPYGDAGFEAGDLNG
jgi:hypothetical protein